MKKLVQEYFYYTQSERNGLLFLLLLIVLMMVFPLLYSRFIPAEPVDFSDFQKQIEAFSQKQQKTTVLATESLAEYDLFYFDPNTASAAKLVRLGLSEGLATTIINYRNKGGRFKKAEDLKKIYGLKAAEYERLAPYITIKEKPSRIPENKAISQAATAPPETFPFNPNTADSASLMQLGLSPKTIGILLNYRRKGGQFRKKEDLAKIYGLSEKTYTRLRPYTRIEAAPGPKQKPQTQSKAEKPQALNINTADEAEWQKLKGIGPSFAKRIVKFREKLGGFAKIEQLAEVYGLPDSTYQNIRAYLLISPVFRKIPLNSASKEELAAHPYISFKQAQVIVNYRQQHGPFSKEANLEDLVVFSRNQAVTLAPYLTFE